MYRGKKVGIAVPAYNEEGVIGETLRSIPEFVDRIYVVDDASTDRTSEVVEEIARKDPRVVLIRHKTNQGVGGAIVSGWKKGLEEGMDILAVMSGDNQMDPKYLPALLDPIAEGKADFSKGTRFKGDYWKDMPRVRIFGTLLLNVLTKIASGYWNVNDPQNGYVAISSNALRKIDMDSLNRGYAFENDVLIKAQLAGLRVVNVPVRIRYRVGEKSKLKISKFTVSTSWFLLRSFVWRVWKQYVLKGHLLGIIYLAGLGGIVGGIAGMIWSPRTGVKVLVISAVVFTIACEIERRSEKNENSDLH